MSYSLQLPIDDFLSEALSLLQTRGNLVVTAAPGAGKTTRLPAYLAQHLRGKILVLEPRRMAAMAAAQRIAEEQSWTLGQEVGYQVRFANKTSAKTNLFFLTEALLSRRMATDPELQDVECVVLDEFHERSMHVDLALGLLRELQELGRDLKIVVMSATLNAAKISKFLGDAPILDVPGKLFPLEIKYQKGTQLLQTPPSFYENLAGHIKEAERTTDKDILVFLPGVGEIDRTANALQTWSQQLNIDLVPLHGSLPLEMQRRALEKGPRKKVLLSTNIAESSVTVDGVGFVIDSGLAKNMKFDMRTGFSRLEMGRISKASAQQRAGRAARQFPGTCLRLWNKLDESSMPDHDVPEILRVELSESLLLLAAQGVRDFNQFSWFEKPPQPALNKALENLQALGALDETQTITAIGREILRWPLPPRLARLMMTAVQQGLPHLGADIAALLQERDFLPRNFSESLLGDQYENDILPRLEILNQFREKRAPAAAHRMALQTVDQASRQILALAKSSADEKPLADKNLRVQRLLLSAFADRLCRRRNAASDKALMVGGRGVKLSPESLVKKSDFFLALDGVESGQSSETVVSRAAGIDRDFLFAEFASEIKKRKDLSFDRDKGQFYVREARHWKDLPLEEGGVSLAKPEDVREHLPEILTKEWDLVLKENEAFAEWVQRLAFLFRHKSQIKNPSVQEFLQDRSEDELLTEQEKREAFTMAASGEKDFYTVVRKDLIYFFEQLFPAEVGQYLGAELPNKIQVPSGSLMKVHYPPDKAPYIEVRIQEVFGWTETPRVLSTLIPLTLHLLGPNYRPMQVTNNLTSFWQSGYAEVRKELRLRYPKHSWPEDPLTAKAEAKGRPRK